MLVHKKIKPSFGLALSVIFTTSLLAACQKTPLPEEPANEASVPQSAASAPTGLVKNPYKHSGTADVTKWMDMASTKTPAQIAQEEKLAKDAKLAQEAKALAEKSAANSRETSKPAAVVPQTVAPKVIEPVAVAPAPAPAPVVAAATPKTTPPPTPMPAATPAPEQTVLKLLTSTQPKFPNKVARSGITSGVVKARVHIDTDGKVSQVEILSAKPARLFDAEVISAVSQWKYAPISKPQTLVLEFNFKLED
ncbi:energy transducer TonB [Undibacterium sp. RTI2.1]|uniref:energy transducer TonB n=1 Tax=unclassified Undibacterium TaxID=2630295 RepID=UPI002AB4579E|nr:MULTISPECIES: energy transducer TonB [unclassified Undibacterium]MDY7539581.1 energy transducer TonB [Undibacterium sp. 5I1]MEB0030116.1 energy transducer TonB [Undibacterium sp. RTI2.1]MEB0116644.1 energy transducer TonB [Undibacterium sp. RTI2.2]MEB0230469.1 energy transducer TonB [Undibacterium sp. 10I3]MEB0258469.1 energy transducer TonB [Undibacterium sp. 5I1]